MSYIKPNLKKYDSLKLLLESKDSIFFFEPNINIDQLPKHSRVFLVSEPGYGKTRLLKERILGNAQAGIFLDLKKLGKQNIETYLTITNFPILKNTKYNEELKNWKLFKTKNFELKDSEDKIFCFDALDEVKQEDFSEVVESIKNFIQKYEKSNFLISCRKNYLYKWQHLFSEINFDYIEIYPLDTPKVKEFLFAFGIVQGRIDDLLEKLHFQNRKYIIQTPRYLEMIAELVQEEGMDKLENINRGELFERFIYQKLHIESEITNEANNCEIVKKVLEKLALIMEIYQSNQITKDELMEFLDDTKSNLNISFLNQVSINSFYERSLLKDNIDFIEFENTEFQEYLAAKEISRLGRVEQVIFDLGVVKELGEINPSWINTLSFLIESDIDLLKNILEYIFSNEQRIHIEEHIKLLTKHNIEKLSAENRRLILKMVYSYYQNAAHWIDYDVAEKLSFYFDTSLHDLIEEFATNKGIEGDTKKVVKANSATMIAFLLERGVLTKAQKEDWKKRIKDFINEKDPHEVVLRRALFALGKFKDIGLFTPQLINKILKTAEDTIITNLIYALEDIQPNHSTSFKCFLKGIKINNISARHALYKVDSKDAIKQILDTFIKDDILLHQFIEYESIYRNGDEEFFRNIEKNVDAEVIKKLKKIITNAFSGRLWYMAEKSNFIKEIVLLTKRYFPNFIFELITNSTGSNTLFALKNIFSLILEKDDVRQFIESIRSIDNNSTLIALQTLQQIKYSNRKDREDIYEEGRQYLGSEYVQAESRQTQFDSEQKLEEVEIYNDFKHRLEPEINKYIPNVFQFYVNNKDKLAPFIKEDDKKRLEKLIKESIFDKFDPGDQILTINKRENGSTSYTTHEWIFIFGTCILAAKELGIDISPYRQKILNYIPFAYNNHCEAIFDQISNPTEKELKNVLKLHKGRSDDLTIFMPSSTIDFCKKYGIKHAIPILKYFVNSDQISLCERQSALKAIAKLAENEKEYFQIIFNEYKAKTDEQQTLSYTANNILIEKFKDEDAINWRFEEIKNRAFPFRRAKGVHSVGRQESEIDDKEFAQPLMQLKDVQYKEKFLELLKDSFGIIEKGEDYFAYTSYLWSIVIEYFKNLKELRSFKILQDIDNFITKYSKQKGMNWFCYQYQQLKLEYIVYIGKPQNIADCIKKYNYFKENIYLDISTPRDLLDLIKKIINHDLKKWVEVEGAYKFIDKYKPEEAQKFEREDLIQKTIKTQFENGLLKAGLRKEEIHIQRESQLLDDKRTDFLISYGFVGPILIEIKLTNNNEITDKRKREGYKQKLIQYIEGTNSHYGIFIIFQVVESSSLEKYLPLLKELYKMEKNIEITGLNCIK